MSDIENKEEVWSKAVKAGKRTYFFDVKATRGRDLYLTITESKRQFNDGGGVHYSKHKLFLYREDFEKFENGFLDSVEKIDELMQSGDYRDPIAERKERDARQPDENSSDFAVASEPDGSESDDASDEASTDAAPEADKDDSAEDVSFEDLD